MKQLGYKLKTKQITIKKFKEQMLGILKTNNVDLSDLIGKNATTLAAVDANKAAVICLSVLAFNVAVAINVAIAVNGVLAVNLAVGVNAAIGYNVALAVHKYVGASLVESKSNLYVEKYINSIANAF